ncbi:threonine--tRNA ligase [Patescibacteria group bacterium]|nr:threonine--tRNA ligase [Patescibacteria group bacterium]
MKKVTNQENQLNKIRHSLSHLMATAVLKKFPKTHLAIGPTIENGFYYDFDLPKDQKISDEDLPKIEQEMKKLIKRKIEFKKSEVSKKEALKNIKGPYKKELLNELAKKITFYQSADFIDLCAGPHVKSTAEINPQTFKLTKVAGAYWRGDEKNKMLTRIYGVAFTTKKQLDHYLKMIKEAEERDHRKLGKDLQLFIIDPLVGNGLPLFLPKGTIIRNELMNYLQEEQIKRGYQYVTTPHIGKLELYKTSGHYPYYKDSQYPPFKIDNEKFLLKPMNCPHHITIYQAEKHSYKELPIKLAECGMVYRYEKSGELNGLIRVRGFTIDDAHIFATEQQIEKEFLGVVDLVLAIFKVLDFKNYWVRIGTHDPASKKHVGDDKIWEKAEKIIIKTLKDKFDYTIEKGDAAFYGPKMDFMVKDVLDREWQLGTVQLDFNLPQRFNLTYIDNKGKEKRPVIIHRAPFGSLERFIGILIEHFGGNFPLWLAPVQVKIISVGSAHLKYCEELAEKFQRENIRVEIDCQNETVGNKIRKSIKEKIPYLLVIGDKEMKSDNLAVRIRGQKKLWEVKLTDFINKSKKLITERKNEL